MTSDRRADYRRLFEHHALFHDLTAAELDAFDTRSQEIVSSSGAATTDALRSGNTGILVLAIVTLLLGIAAAGLAVWGIGLRRREYS